MTLDQFDHLLNGDEIAALTASQKLVPVEGPDAVIFPPTFAPQSKTEKGDYNIDRTGASYHAHIDYDPADGNGAKVRTDIRHDAGRNVCIIDTVGAQANRIEPMFKAEKCGGRYADLVPQVRVRVECKKPGLERVWFVNLLDAGHRAGDAIIRFSPLGERVFAAFKALGESGNADPLARIAPTSLVFGVWDSRGTQEKVARAFRSVIRATDVVRLTRSAQYFRATKYAEHELVPEDLDAGEGDKNPLSREGFNDNPATGPGGVRVYGEIRRDMAINLAAIRRLRVPKGATDPYEDDAEQTLALRRYILGLSLVAATGRIDDKYNLREGCQLRQQPGTAVVLTEVRYEGDDTDRPELTADVCERYARLAAQKFKVEREPIVGDFDPKTAERWLRLTEKQQKQRRLEAPMTKQDFGRQEIEKLKGVVGTLKADESGITVVSGSGQNKKERELVLSTAVECQDKDGKPIPFGDLKPKDKVQVEIADEEVRLIKKTK